VKPTTRFILTQSHKYDWLRLDKIRLAAATWWRRLRGLSLYASIYSTWYLRQPSKCNFGLLSPWPLTSWPPRSTVHALASMEDSFVHYSQNNCSDKVEIWQRKQFVSGHRLTENIQRSSGIALCWKLILISGCVFRIFVKCVQSRRWLYRRQQRGVRRQWLLRLQDWLSSRRLTLSWVAQTYWHIN